MTKSVYLNPEDIMFSQSTIGKEFKDGRRIADTLKKLKKKEISIEAIPPIRVIQQQGVWVSIDNRRLWVFKQLRPGLILVDEMSDKSLLYGSKKLTRTNVVTVRGDRSYNFTIFCEVCNRCFKNSEARDNHLRAKCCKITNFQAKPTLSKKRPPPDYGFNCEFCSSVFITSSWLLRHTKKEHNWPCNSCYRSYRNKSILLRTYNRTCKDSEKRNQHFLAKGGRFQYPDTKSNVFTGNSDLAEYQKENHNWPCSKCVLHKSVLICTPFNRSFENVQAKHPHLAKFCKVLDNNKVLTLSKNSHICVQPEHSEIYSSSLRIISCCYINIFPKSQFSYENWTLGAIFAIFLALLSHFYRKTVSVFFYPSSMLLNLRHHRTFLSMLGVKKNDKIWYNSTFYLCLVTSFSYLVNRLLKILKIWRRNNPSKYR